MKKSTAKQIAKQKEDAWANAQIKVSKLVNALNDACDSDEITEAKELLREKFQTDVIQVVRRVLAIDEAQYGVQGRVYDILKKMNMSIFIESISGLGQCMLSFRTDTDGLVFSADKLMVMTDDCHAFGYPPIRFFRRGDKPVEPNAHIKFIEMYLELSKRIDDATLKTQIGEMANEFKTQYALVAEQSETYRLRKIYDRAKVDNVSAAIRTYREFQTLGHNIRNCNVKPPVCMTKAGDIIIDDIPLQALRNITCDTIEERRAIIAKVQDVYEGKLSIDDLLEETKYAIEEMA